MTALKKSVERPSFEVHLDASELGPAAHIGYLYPSMARLDLAPSFEYTKEWLGSGSAVSIDPQLPLYAGEQHSRDGAGFGIFSDCAPDRWGRVLMERREASNARQEGRNMRRLDELSFMLGVHDFTRAGALRFRRSPQEPFLDNSELPAPPETDLRELAYVAKLLDGPRPEALPEYDKWLSMLIAPGSSLGGARPKASFTMDDGTLWLAKFPGHNDRHDWGTWEYLTHGLAEQAGLTVPKARRLLLGERHHTFCVQRFDREPGPGGVGQQRKMYASAMTLLERRDNQRDASYLDIVEALDNLGGTGLTGDLHQLFRRAVFNLLVGNRDDHLRNHGFLLTPTGWRLSPAFDLNPNPDKHEHSLTWDGISAAPDLDILSATAAYYRILPAQANVIAEDVRNAVATWRAQAAALELPRVEIQMMEHVFAV